MQAFLLASRAVFSQFIKFHGEMICEANLQTCGVSCKQGGARGANLGWESGRCRLEAEGWELSCEGVDWRLKDESWVGKVLIASREMGNVLGIRGREC